MLLLPAILTGIGLLALLLGLRGRRGGTEPRCRKCLFSLEGLTNPTVCPECGRDVTTPKSTRLGIRKRNVIAIAAGSMLLLGGGGWFANGVYTAFTGPDWARRVPTWWLVNIEARWATGQRLAAAIGGLGGTFSGETWTPDRARFSQVLFERFSASPPFAPLTTGDTLAMENVRWWIEKNEVAPDRVARLIAESLYVEPLKPSAFPPPPAHPGLLRAPIVPDGWLVSYSWRQVNAAGSDVGLTCTGMFDRVGELSRHLDESSIIAGTPVRTFWKVEVRRDTPSAFGPVIHEFETPCAPPQTTLHPLRAGR